MSGELALGVVLVTVCAAAWRFRWLTPAGGVAALAVGVAVLAGSGAGGLALLALFFVTASALTTWNPARRRSGALGRSAAPREGATGGGAASEEAVEVERRGDAAGRGARQVAANGGVAAGAALLGLAGVLPLAQVALAGALAAAAADTWATETGTAVGGPTRRIGTWERVPPGRSGGISAAGTAGGLAGALLLGAAAALLVPAVADHLGSGVAAAAAVAAGGIAGMTADSLMGAHLEERVRGIDNHTVNLAGTAVGAIGAWLLAAVAGG